MSKKAAAKSSTPASTANVLPVIEEPGKSRERLTAQAGLSAFGASADTARMFAKSFIGEIGIGDAVAVLRDKADKVQRGDLAEVEARLTAQAVALDAIFNGMAKRAALNMGEHLGACETYMRLALKAQASYAENVGRPKESSQISDAISEAQPTKIRTDEAVSELANVSRDTIRKIERIEEVAQPEAAALVEVLKTLRAHPLVAWCERMNSGAAKMGGDASSGDRWNKLFHLSIRWPRCRPAARARIRRRNRRRIRRNQAQHQPAHSPRRSPRGPLKSHSRLFW